MYPDGVCRLTKNTFSKCIAFEDISYQLAQPDTKTAIFEHLCDLYNYVDASIHVQFSFLNRRVDPVQYAKSFEMFHRLCDNIINIKKSNFLMKEFTYCQLICRIENSWH